jgi:RNA polymerase sigma factor (TIGR02999 family)
MAETTPAARHHDSATGARGEARGDFGQITTLLRQIGTAGVGERLVELIYPNLRRLAQRQLKRERPGHVLQPTALVHEAYLRLVDHHDHDWKNRMHFFAAAANVMRRILVDHARAQRARKRAAPPMALPEAVTGCEGSITDVIALSEALDALARESPRHARVVELRYFGGLSVHEAAAVLAVTPRTVDRDWAAARAWLRVRLQS